MQRLWRQSVHEEDDLKVREIFEPRNRLLVNAWGEHDDRADVPPEVVELGGPWTRDSGDGG